MRNFNFTSKDIRQLAGVIIGGLWSRGLPGKAAAILIAPYLYLDAICSSVVVTLVNTARRPFK